MLITKTAWETFSYTAEAPIRAAGEIRSLKARHLYAWWVKHAVDGLPLRRSFDIVEHRANATQIILVEVLSDGSFRTKIVGSRMLQWVEDGREGSVLSASNSALNARWLYGYYTRLVATRVAWLNRGQVYLTGQGEVTYEGVDCPLSEDGQTVSSIIGLLDLI